MHQQQEAEDDDDDTEFDTGDAMDAAEQSVQSAVNKHRRLHLHPHASHPHAISCCPSASSASHPIVVSWVWQWIDLRGGNSTNNDNLLYSSGPPSTSIITPTAMIVDPSPSTCLLASAELPLQLEALDLGASALSRRWSIPPTLIQPSTIPSTVQTTPNRTSRSRVVGNVRTISDAILQIRAQMSGLEVDPSSSSWLRSQRHMQEQQRLRRPPPPPRIGICECPGKIVNFCSHLLYRKKVHRDLKLDLDRLVHVYQATTIVNCLSDAEMSFLNVPWPKYHDQTIRHGLNIIRIPMPDGGVPKMEDLFHTLSLIHHALQQDRHSVVVHCRSGVGRASLVVACYLLQRGVFTSAARAITHLRARRSPRAIQTRFQESFLRTFQALLDARPELLIP